MDVEDVTVIDTESDGIPDWIDYPNDLVNENAIHRELGLTQRDIPRHRATVLYGSYEDTFTSLSFSEGIVRIECRVGNSGDIGERYDVGSLVNNENFVCYRLKDEPTYVNFFFEPTDKLNEVIDMVK